MKVIHLTSSLDPKDGGTVAALSGLAIAQANQGARVKVISTFRRNLEPAAISQLRAAGVEVVLVGPVISPLAWHPLLKRTLRKELGAADIVHIHGLWEEIQHQTAVVSRSMGIPYIFTPHGMLDPWCLAQSRFKKWAYIRLRLANNLANAAAVHFTADMEKNQYPDTLASRKSVTIPNGIDTAEYKASTEPGSFRFRHQIPSNIPLALYLGRLHPKKGINILIEGFAKAKSNTLNEQVKDAVLVIAGPDQNRYQRTIEKLANDYGISDQVRFVGPLYGKEKLEAYFSADIFALVSHQENFGITVLEAMAAGCAVLVSDQVAIHSLISAEGLGLVVPTDANRVASALVSLLSSPLNLTQMRGRASSVAAQFDWNIIANQFLRLYRELLTNASNVQKGSAA